MNEPEDALNYSPLETEADALAKFEVKLHVPLDPFLAIAV